MSDKNMSYDDLVKLFESAQATPPEPSLDFMARVLSDAQMMQPAALGVMTTSTPKRGFVTELFSGLSDAIGGWPAFAGLATAAVTGLWIGIAPPDTLLAPLDTMLGTDTSALIETLEYGDGFDFTLFEG